MIELKVGYFDSRTHAQGTILSSYDEIYTLGFGTKNDGGGGHYKRYDHLTQAPPLGFATTVPGDQNPTKWGLVPDGGVVNPFQAGAKGDGATNDQPALVECIGFVKWWRDANNTVTSHPAGHPNDNPFQEQDSSRTAVKLVIPGNHIFLVDRTVTGQYGTGLDLTGPITIEGEDRLTSVIRLKENSVEPTTPATPSGGAGDGNGSGNSLFYSSLAVDPAHPDVPTISGITFRNFTVMGSYGNSSSGTAAAGFALTHGIASLFTFNNFANVLFEDVVFTRNRAVIIDGGGSRNLTMRGCTMSIGRRGGLVISNADNTEVDGNTFAWVGDDPVAIVVSTPGGAAWARMAGGATRVTRNFLFGCRAVNLVGVKQALVADNIFRLCRGRAIHIGTTTFQQKGDTTTLDIQVVRNDIGDMLDAGIDPDFELPNSGHRAIDIELLHAAPGPLPAIPGLPDGTQKIVDPTRYYYTGGQGLQGAKIWKAGLDYDSTKPAPDNETWWLGRLYSAQNTAKTKGDVPPVHISGTAWDGAGNTGVNWKFESMEPTPHSGRVLVADNIIARSRPPAVATGPDHVDGYNSFDDYLVGPWGGFVHEYVPAKPPVTVSLADITPSEGIAISGAVRWLTLRGNQIHGCDTSILFYGRNLPLPFTLLDVVIEQNDLSDWGRAGIRFQDYADYGNTPWPQRVAILGNRANGDPLHHNQTGHVRKANGFWANTTADIAATDTYPAIPAGTGAFIDAAGLGMVLVADNHVRNASQLVAGFDAALHSMRGNVAYCDPRGTPYDPLGTSYDPLNRGIGVLIHPALGWRYVIEGSDPTDPANYGKVSNPCPLAVAAATRTTPTTPPVTFYTPPTGFKWVEGTTVANRSPTVVGSGAGRYWVSGWRRTSTGTGDDLNTHWWELRTPINP